MKSSKGNAPLARRVGRKAQGIGTSRQAKNITQKATIGAALKSGESLTPLSALTRFGCFRLAAVVHALRRSGLRIATQRVSVRRSDGSHAYVASYTVRRART